MTIAADRPRVPVALVDGFSDDVHTRLATRLQKEGVVDGSGLRELAKELLQDAFRDHERRRINEGNQTPLGPQLEALVRDAVLDRLFSYGPLQPYLDPGSGVSEVNINGCDQVWLTYVDGSRRLVDERLFPSDADLVEWVSRQARDSPRHEYTFSKAFPLLEMDLPNGDRLAAAMDVVTRPSVSIRRHDLVRLATLDDLVGVGFMDHPVRDFLEALVRARKNLIISGGTGAGKTTLARTLANAVEPWERIVTVEDVAELRLERFPQFHDQVIAMRRRPPNTDGRGEVTIAQLTWAALRYNPDRLIVGEVRGAEVIPMVNAMAQGNDGSFCTVHATSSQAAPRKLQSYASIAPERWTHDETAWMLRDAVHAVVHVEFDRANNKRHVSSIRVVSGVQGKQLLTDEVFGPDREGRAVATGVGLDEVFLTDLRRVGFRSESLRTSAA